MPATRVVLVVAAAALGLFGYAYLASPHRPGGQFPDGYYGWSDQMNYRLEAEALRDGVLPGSDYDYARREPEPGYDPSERPLYDYAYGLGYPVVAVPALLVGFARDPFLPFDAVAFVAVVVAVVELGRRLRSLTFGVVAAAALVLATPLLDFTVVPWNTTITVLAVVAALWIATDESPHPIGHPVALGVAVGLCFAARYFDALFPAVIGSVGLARHARPLRSFVLAGAIALVFVAGVLWTHEVVFHDPFETPYAHHVRADGTSDQSIGSFDLGRAPRSFYEVFVMGEYEGVRLDADPMLVAFPWLVLAPVGLVLLVRDRRPGAPAYVVAAATSLAGTVLYLSFRAGTGLDLEHFNLRYFIAWVPLWALLGVYAAARGLDVIRGAHARGRTAASAAAEAGAGPPPVSEAVPV